MHEFTDDELKDMIMRCVVVRFYTPWWQVWERFKCGDCARWCLREQQRRKKAVRLGS